MIRDDKRIFLNRLMRRTDFQGHLHRPAFNFVMKLKVVRFKSEEFDLNRLNISEKLFSQNCFVIHVISRTCLQLILDAIYMSDNLVLHLKSLTN